jgi:hypothetical protein
MANKCDVPVRQGIRHIGIDDWAYRKGHTYGTILVDRETGKAVDLIKSREKEDITLWLKAHPGIETVTRDRAECYSQSADMALPGAVQITDRFHLIVNYSDYVAKISRKLLTELRRIKPEKLELDHTHDQEIQQIIDLACGRHFSQDKKGVILKAKELYRKGYSMRRITRILQLNFRTVHKYIENDIGQIQTCRTPLIDYSSHIETLISGYRKGEKLSVVYRKMKGNGFKGSQRSLSARFGEIYGKDRQTNCDKSVREMKRQYLPHTVSPKKLAIYLANKNYEKILSSDEIRIFERFKDNNPLLKELWDLSAGFRDIFEKRSITIFHEWTDRVMHSPFNSLKRFVKGLYKDLHAVIAAIEKPDNNGITEGNVNRLKNIKRQMYGRAGFELLRRKVVLSSTG